MPQGWGILFLGADVACSERKFNSKRTNGERVMMAIANAMRLMRHLLLIDLAVGPLGGAVMMNRLMEIDGDGR